MAEKERVLVTGGTGVTGVALVRHLLRKNKEVTAIVRPHSKRSRYLPEDKDLHVVECSLADYDRIGAEELGKDYSVFYHLAWDGSTGKEKVDNRNNMQLQAQNIQYDIKAVELCRRIECPVFLATGTQAEYGLCDTVINEETETYPENGYGSAKLCAGQMTRILCNMYGIKHIWARLFSVYGPYDGTQSLIYTSMLKLMSGKCPKYTAGKQIWDYLYSFDAARALALLGEKGRAGEIYCVANGKSEILRSYILKLHEVVNPEIPGIFGEIPYTSNQVMNLQVDTKKLRQDTGFIPEYTFEDGIKEIFAWCKRELQILTKNDLNELLF